MSAAQEQQGERDRPAAEEYSRLLGTLMTRSWEEDSRRER